MPERAIEPPFISPRLFPVAQDGLGTDDYYTPPWVFERMGITFDLDVAAPPGGVAWVPADRYFTMEDDGLTQPWEGRVWMNPPYSNLTPWVGRFIAHAHGICLVPHARSQWHERLWATADALVHPGRFNFIGHRSNGEVMYPLLIAAFGAECVKAVGKLGVVRTKVDCG